MLVSSWRIRQTQLVTGTMFRLRDRSKHRWSGLGWVEPKLSLPRYRYLVMKSWFTELLSIFGQFPNIDVFILPPSTALPVGAGLDPAVLHRQVRLTPPQPRPAAPTPASHGCTAPPHSQAWLVPEQFSDKFCQAELFAGRFGRMLGHFPSPAGRWLPTASQLCNKATEAFRYLDRQRWGMPAAGPHFVYFSSLLADH